MTIEKKFFERAETRLLKSVDAIVTHWPAGRGIPDIDGLWKWMNENTDRSYHFFISKKRVIQCRPLEDRAIHAGHVTYRKKAKEFFGYDVCSKNDSPNNHTLATCMLHDNYNGSYNHATMDTSIELHAGLCFKFNLDPMNNLWRHSDITNEKSTPCPKGFFEDDNDPDDLWNSFKHWVDSYMRVFFTEARDTK